MGEFVDGLVKYFTGVPLWASAALAAREAWVGMDGPRKVSASGLRSPGNSDPRRVASGPALQHQTSHVNDSAAVGIPVYTSIRIIQVSQIDPVLQCFKSRFDLSVHWNPSVVGDESALAADGANGDEDSNSSSVARMHIQDSDLSWVPIIRFPNADEYTGAAAILPRDAFRPKR